MSEQVRVTMTVNGIARTAELPARQLLVYYLRDQLGLTGTKVGCDTSSCGACTVLLGSESVKSCTVFAAQADGEEIVTIEGLAPEGSLHPLQQAFREQHALQCGYCTPGMVLAVLSLLRERPGMSADDIRRGLDGNLCRCTGYTAIIAAACSVSDGEGGRTWSAGTFSEDGQQ